MKFLDSIYKLHTNFVREESFLKIKLIKIGTCKRFSYKLDTNYFETQVNKGFQSRILIEWE